MKNSLLRGLKEELDNFTLTENLSPAFKSTLDANLDLFGNIGAMRGQESKVVEMFKKAIDANPTLALRILFYARDIRGGQGERSVFRACLKWAADSEYAESIGKNIHLIPEYGRWDDLLVFIGTPLERAAINKMYEQFVNDMKNLKDGKGVSLLGKWLPSENTSSKETRRLAGIVRRCFGFTPKEYRKRLTKLRKAIRIVESDMSADKWGEINYSGVPSKAMSTYNKAFHRHDDTRFTKYVNDLKSGETKINSSALYPYELVRKYISNFRTVDVKDDIVEEQWRALPNYLEGNEHNALVLCDVSGSMFSTYGNGAPTPILVSTSLAVYIAEHNKGYFHNHFLTFTDKPQLVSFGEGDSLLKKLDKTFADVGYNTNIDLAFLMILDTAVRNNVSQGEMPEIIYAISDMQFDVSFIRGKTNFESIKKMYADAGYKMPKLVFWNVASKGTVPITKKDENTILVSGCNPVIFEQVISGTSPTDFMMKTISKERYSAIQA